VSRASLALAVLLTACAPPPVAPPPAAPAPCPEEPADPAYVPRAAPTVGVPALPAPVAPAFPIKVDDDYTVRGAIHHLRSRAHADEVTRAPITVTGYIVRTNLADAPQCSLHRTGRGDPEGCTPPIPSFSIADEPGNAGEAIQVLGWASTFAQLYSLMEALDRAPQGEQVTRRDEFLGHVLPTPVPAVGAKVRVTGRYGFTAGWGRHGATDPRHGVLSFVSMSTLSPAPKKATLPRKKRP
jgi:hypothetical protein